MWCFVDFERRDRGRRFSSWSWGPVWKRARTLIRVWARVWARARAGPVVIFFYCLLFSVIFYSFLSVLSTLSWLGLSRTLSSFPSSFLRFRLNKLLLFSSFLFYFFSAFSYCTSQGLFSSVSHIWWSLHVSLQLSLFSRSAHLNESQNQSYKYSSKKVT